MVDQGRTIYNRFMRKWLENNNFLLYLTYNESKSVIADRFIKNLNGKIYKKNDSQLQQALSELYEQISRSII